LFSIVEERGRSLNSSLILQDLESASSVPEQDLARIPDLSSEPVTRDHQRTYHGKKVLEI